MPLARAPGRPGPGGAAVPRSAKPGDLPARREPRADGVFRHGGKRAPRPPGPRPFVRQRPGRPRQGDAMTATTIDTDTTARARAVLHVCTTCRHPSPADAAPDAPRPGALLLADLLADPPEGVEVRGIECLSVCGEGCAVALSGPGRWGYVYGRLDPALHAADIRAGAALYAATADGIVPWRDRPQVFRKQSVARIPPLESKP